jgi:DNA-binding CsgD family transcriptional regulator
MDTPRKVGERGSPPSPPRMKRPVGGLIITDAACRVLALDRNATRLLRAGVGLRESGGRLRAAPEREDARLSRLVAAAAEGGREAKMQLGPASGPTVTLLLAQLQVVTPIRSGSNTAILFDETESLAVGGIADRYGLTPAEAHLAVELAAGNSLKEAAHHLGIRINTARAQLRALFGKTGTNRQAALVRRLLLEE